MNNKPVAWMFTLPDGTHDWILDGNGCEGYIPLYTHPVKELTNEEILEYSDVFALDYSPLYEFTAKGLVLFARAILRKAQEK